MVAAALLLSSGLARAQPNGANVITVNTKKP
jgi:hypothetical protein